jgi:hypothetical protein
MELRTKVSTCLHFRKRLAFGVWRSAFGVRRSAFGVRARARASDFALSLRLPDVTSDGLCSKAVACSVDVSERFPRIASPGRGLDGVQKALRPLREANFGFRSRRRKVMLNSVRRQGDGLADVSLRISDALARQSCGSNSANNLSKRGSFRSGSHPGLVLRSP